MLVSRAMQFQANRSKFFVASNSFMVLYSLQLAEMPKCRDLAIFVLTVTDDRQNQSLQVTPYACMHVCGVIGYIHIILC